uniref:Large ribosomal subunit protein uL10m n=1 Tax=Elaeophora elaphi TaxID=1147741 RepID=A0A0R3S076_9BILA
MSLELSRILPPVLSFHLCTRGKASSNWPLRRPRSYRRRLYDAALEPMVPKVQSVCPSYKGIIDSIEELKSSYSAFDMALVQHIREKIKNEGYQVMGICHRLAVKQRTEWLTRNQLRLKGLEFRDYGNRIMKKVFEGTPLQSLSDTIFVATNAQLFGKDINAIKAVITECEKIDWLTPIAVVYGARILSISEVKELCKLPSLEDHRAQTVQLLSLPPNELISTLNYHIIDITRILDSIKSQKEPSP